MSKRIYMVLASMCCLALVLSLVWAVPYLYTAIGLAAWTFTGQLITIDDDLPGGWSNPDGDMPFPWNALAIKAAVLCFLVALVFFIPALRRFGG